MIRVVPKFEKRSRGFTLLELIVVVAIIALMTSLIWPSLSSAMHRSQLVNAAKQLRTELAQTRLQAIETGTTLQFRYFPGKNRYEIKPAEFNLQQSFEMEEPEDGERPHKDLQDEPQNLSSHEGVHSKTLPDGIRFQENIVFRDPNADFDEEFSGDEKKVPEEESLPKDQVDDDKEIDFEWSKPIIFYPNGRTTNARIDLNGQGNFRIDLTVRGLTGAVILGKIRHGE